MLKRYMDFDQNGTPFAHKKSLGQNFLTSPVVPNWMCDAAEVKSGEIVIEIGPGTGALTKVLLERGATVHAIETDARALLILTHELGHYIQTGQLTLHEGDMRTYDLNQLTDRFNTYKIVANIPYYLSGFLLRVCLELARPPQTLVFLMQKEVVTRIARDKKQSILSLSVAVYGTATYYKTVSRGHFNPPPNVDSAILLVRNISHQHLPTEIDREEFFTLLHHGLGQKRKQLLGLLGQHYGRDTMTEIFNTLSLSPTIRGEDVPLTSWLLLYTTLRSHMHR